jgi:hypothetical protein
MTTRGKPTVSSLALQALAAVAMQRDEFREAMLAEPEPQYIYTQLLRLAKKVR